MRTTNRDVRAVFAALSGQVARLGLLADGQELTLCEPDTVGGERVGQWVLLVRERGETALIRFGPGELGDRNALAHGKISAMVALLTELDHRGALRRVRT